MPVEREIPPPAPVARDSKEHAEWIVEQILAEEKKRARSFYDTGKYIETLLGMASVGAKGVKELCTLHDLGMSHMTANKYLQVARAFARDIAIEHGIEKCYALTLYAKVIGRPKACEDILRRNEVVQGIEGVRAATASASKLYSAVRAIKKAAKEAREPSEIQAAHARTAQVAEAFVRRIGWRGAQAKVVRVGGKARLAIYVSLEIAESLETRVPRALPRYLRGLVKSRPDLVESMRAAGVKLSGSG